MDRIEGHNIAPGVVDWGRGAPGAYRVLRPGGTFEYYYRGANAASGFSQALFGPRGSGTSQVIRETLVRAVT